MSKNDSSGFIEHCKRSRVRKPPGGDTNDIFRLEERQRVQNDRLHVYEDVKIKGDGTWRKHRESEDALAPKENKMRNLRRSLSDCRVSDVNWRSPPLAAGKENMVVYKNLTASRQIAKDPDYASTEDADDEEEDDERLEAEKSSLARNPITGEGLNPAREQEDVASDTSTEQPNQDTVQKKPRRPCIRVREPPGGKSSIIF